jgi:streptogramin lyase
VRRAATYLLVAAVLGVVVAAGLDSLRGGGSQDGEAAEPSDTRLLVIDAEKGDTPESLEVDASVSVQRPAGVTVANGSVWVAGRGALVQIDPERGRVTRTILLGGRPGGVVGDSDAVYVLDQLKGVAVRVDPEAGRIAGRLETDIPVLDVAFADGDAWIPDPAGSAVLRIDPLDGTVAARISVPSPTQVVAAAGEVWALSPVTRVVSRIDPASNLVSVIALDDPPGQLAAAGGTLWVSHPSAGALSRIDPLHDTVTARVELDSEPLLIAGARAGLWVLGVERLAWVDAETGRVAGTASLDLARPPGPQPAILGGLAAGEGAAWIADTYGDRVLRVSAPGEPPGGTDPR